MCRIYFLPVAIDVNNTILEFSNNLLKTQKMTDVLLYILQVCLKTQRGLTVRVSYH